MSTDSKPDWCPQDLWDETSSAFDVLYESEPDLEGGCEYGIRSMAAAVALVAIATERERCAKVCEAVGSDLDPQYADHIAAAIRAAPIKEWGPQREADRQRLAKLFVNKTKEDMRHLWDTVGENSFSGPYDCTDIHSYMNMLGDGEYCAV